MNTDTIPHLLQKKARDYGDRIALRKKDFGIWNEVSWRQYDHMVRCVACGLIALGIGKGDSVSIISKNRLEWVYADIAIMSIGGRTVGIYPTNVAGQVEYIVKHSESKVYIAEDEEQLDKILETRHNCPDLKWIVVIDPKGLRNFKDPMYLSWNELIQRGEELNKREPNLFLSRLSEISEDDVCLLMYTSGTTGPPKGVMMTHRNLFVATSAWADANPHYASDSILSFLPLSHIAQRLFTSLMQVYVGYTVHFGEDELNTLNQDMLEVRPTVYFAVPRIWEKMYSNFVISLKDATWVENKIYNMAMQVAFRYADLKLTRNSIPFWLSIIYRFFDWFVYRKIRETIGLDRCRIANSGAAPISSDLMRYFFAIGINILEGYGLTEGTGADFANRKGHEKIGTVGFPLPCIEAKVAEDGELLIKGNIMKGYFKNPEATLQSIDEDGWLHTGDIVEIDKEGYTQIVDRKKDIIITAGGENIAPQNIENELKFSPYIHDAVVVGDKRKFIAALIVIDEENVAKFAQERKIPYATYADLSQNKEVYALIFKEVQRVNDKMPSVSRIKKFAIIDQELDTDRDELTPTMKVKRSTISKKYEKLIGSFYE